MTARTLIQGVLAVLRVGVMRLGRACNWVPLACHTQSLPNLRPGTTGHATACDLNHARSRILALRSLAHSRAAVCVRPEGRRGAVGGPGGSAGGRTDTRARASERVGAMMCYDAWPAISHHLTMTGYHVERQTLPRPSHISAFLWWVHGVSI